MLYLIFAPLDLMNAVVLLAMPSASFDAKTGAISAPHFNLDLKGNGTIDNAISIT